MHPYISKSPRSSWGRNIDLKDREGKTGNEYVGNIKAAALTCTSSGSVLWHGRGFIVQLLSVEPGKELGWQIHSGDRLLYVEEGQGQVLLKREDKTISRRILHGFGVIVPSGMGYNIINTGKSVIKAFVVCCNRVDKL